MLSRLVEMLAVRSAGPPAADARPRHHGLGRSAGAEAESLSDYLRRGSGEELARRRAVAALSIVGAGAMVAVSAYQSGVIAHLPEPPLPFLDSDRVDASPEAYAAFATPDAALGAVSYATTLVLATMRGRDRASTSPWVPLALATKVAGDALGAAVLTVEQATKHRKFCLYCLVASAASFASLPLVLVEARQALATVRGRR